MNPKPRKREMKSETRLWHTPEGKCYITISYLHARKPREVFIDMSKSGSVNNAWAEVTGRMVSLLLRMYYDPKKLIEKLKHVRGGQPVWFDGYKITSVCDALARYLDIFIGNKGDWE